MLNINDLGNIVVTGSTGRGKTEFMLKYLEEIKDKDYKILIYDPKLIDYIDYEDNPKISRYIDSKEFLSSLSSLINTKNINAGKYILMIDEAACLYPDNSQRHVDSLLEEICLNYKKYNIRYVISSQFDSSISSKIRKNCHTYIRLNSRIN